MTTKQKQNIARFKAVQAEAKKLKAKNKNLTHIQAVKQAWAILYSKERKSPIKKKVGAVKKKAAPKKKAVNKKSSVIKFNTGILSGALKLSPEEKRLGLIHKKQKKGLIGSVDGYKKLSPGAKKIWISINKNPQMLSMDETLELFYNEALKKGNYKKAGDVKQLIDWYNR